MNVQQAAVQRVRGGAQRAQHGLQVGAAPLRASQQDVVVGPACARQLPAALVLTLNCSGEGFGLQLAVAPLRNSRQGVLVRPA